MKFPYAMLRDFVETALDAEAIGHLLTMAGFELEGIEEVEDDSVLDIKVMSNRGDGLSVFGLAREVLAKDASSLPTPLYLSATNGFASVQLGTTPAPTSVDIRSTDCLRYACSVLTGASHRESEAWMQKRLRQAGMRPISLWVDVTNYVMLEVGQPLHAFDYELLAENRIVVRKAELGEELTTLNGIEHKLQPDQMMICDAAKPIAAAGIMGGAETEVSESTKTVLLESAHFLNTSVRRTRKQLGLNTEASYRFERSVDPAGVAAAIHRCFSLLSAADPGIVSTAIVDVYPVHPTPKTLTLRVNRASTMLGMPITEEQAGSYLSRLGFTIELSGPGEYSVQTPTWRPDIVREIDLIEELGRVHGYDQIPETMIQGTTTLGGPQGFQLWTDWLRDASLNAGYNETVSHSLGNLHPLDAPGTPRIGPRTPSSPDMAYLRSSVLSSLGEVARRNNPKEVRAFEIGHVFWGTDPSYEEEIRLGILASGPLLSGDWSVKESGQVSFFTVKGDLDAILGQVGVSATLTPPTELDPRLHPTRQAVLSNGDIAFGILGQLHPDVAKETSLPPDTIVAEIRLAKAFEARSTGLKLHSVSRHPAVRRDMSVLLDKSVDYGDVAVRIEEAGGAVLERHWLFDVFSGQGIPEGKHALGIAIQLRKPDSTITDEEANQVRDRVVSALADLGATTR